jgi:hypothetical protein
MGYFREGVDSARAVGKADKKIQNIFFSPFFSSLNHQTFFCMKRLSSKIATSSFIIVTRELFYVLNQLGELKNLFKAIFCSASNDNRKRMVQ